MNLLRSLMGMASGVVKLAATCAIVGIGAGIIFCVPIVLAVDTVEVLSRIL